MPQDLFKWEDAGGLKHHCPICQTPLSHDKCRTTCLGIHVEWCHRYHTLFRKNWSSRCSACKTTDEQHEKRHREIAEVLARIKKAKADEEAAAMELLASPATLKTPRTPLTAKALDTVDGASVLVTTPRSTKKERKAIKKAAKALERDKVVTTADIQAVVKALHPSGMKASDLAPAEEDDGEPAEDLAEDLDIRMNLKFNSSTCNTKSARHDFIVREREHTDIDDSELNKILHIFEVDAKAVGPEGELVKELIAAIKKDLMCFHDELATTSRNKAGFWRWANKRAYRDMVENGKDWDAKSHWEHDTTAPGGERRDSEHTVGTETDEERSRTDSCASSNTDSTRTSLTVPSTKASSSKNAETPVNKSATAVNNGGRKQTGKKPTVSNMTAPVKKVAAMVDDDGFTQVGKKVLKSPPGKLTLASNGGLHHLGIPKTRFGAIAPHLEIPKGDRNGPRPVQPDVNTDWGKAGSDSFEE